MMFSLRAFEAGGILLAGFVIYRFVIRPWRRDGQPSTDGLLVIGFATVWFQDPFSTYYVNWFTYNTNLVNFGSWVQDVPGWVSPGGPGATIAEPILFIGPSYVYFLLLGVLFGSWVMRTAKRRWPSLQPFQLLGICFAAMCILDLVAEGLIWMPLGFWSYPGGHGIIFPSDVPQVRGRGDDPDRAHVHGALRVALLPRRPGQYARRSEGSSVSAAAPAR